VCGIAGVLALRDHAAPPSRDELLRMAGALRHRGPDELGIYRSDRAGLAHARLSIIDLSSGQQPMESASGHSVIAYNGEVFNYVELRGELERLGARFRTQSDTEVVLAAIDAWGEDALLRFNGQFAIAVWDARRGRLTLARDRLGIRPLYVCEHEGRLAFASEVKALFLGLPGLPRELDSRGLAETLTFWSVVPPQSIFAGIAELEPGWFRVIEPARGIDRAAPFWRPTFPRGAEGERSCSVEEAAEAVGGALERATSLRMLRADVPVGSYLSGGLDSSLIAAMGLAAKKERFATFSIRFEDAEYDETPFQRAMVAHLGSDHHEVLVRRSDIADSFPTVIDHIERPILRTAPAPLWALSKLVRESGIKVVLTGEGADEVFAGYDLFREAKVRRFWAKSPDSTCRPRLLERLYPYLARSPVAQQAMARKFFGKELGRAGEPGFGHELRWSSTPALLRILHPDRRSATEAFDVRGDLLASAPPELSEWSPLAQDQYFEMRTLLSGYLLSSQGDRMLMAHSVEGRFPFLDPEVVALGASLPPSHKLRVLDEKHVLKRLGRAFLPAEILDRTKQPYRAPDALAFVAPHGAEPPGWIGDVIGEAAVEAAGVFDKRAVAALWNKCRTKRDAQLSNTDNMALVAVLSTQLLHQRFVRDGCASFAWDPPLTTDIDRTGGAS
jgi:asparagine synthase (glutamine-hydrolysing)